MQSTKATVHFGDKVTITEPTRFLSEQSFTLENVKPGVWLSESELESITFNRYVCNSFTLQHQDINIPLEFEPTNIRLHSEFYDVCIMNHNYYNKLSQSGKRADKWHDNIDTWGHRRVPIEPELTEKFQKFKNLSDKTSDVFDKKNIAESLDLFEQLQKFLFEYGFDALSAESNTHRQSGPVPWFDKYSVVMNACKENIVILCDIAKINNEIVGIKLKFVDYKF